MNLITLTTDFGTQDWFVGSMKGVMLDLAPKARFVDITHEIPPGDIRGGAFSLMAAAPYFPKGTHHLAIVDPGVGSSRRPIAIKTQQATFIGPDNGLLSWAVRGQEIVSVLHITNSRLFRHPVSRTFHGRDVFSPVTARLATGVKFESLGPAITDWIRLPWPEPAHSKNGIVGEILHVDRFGNAITNLPHNLLNEDEWSRANVGVKRHKLGAPQSSYSAGTPGRPLAILSSSGFLEIAINGGSARDVLGLAPGCPVRLMPGRSKPVTREA